MPSVNVAGDMSMPVVDMMVLAKVASTKSEARRLVEGGGVKINDTKVSAVTTLVSEVVDKNEFVLHKGKKVHVKVVIG
jgi:tyrosyl-tRNA synthetase